MDDRNLEARLDAARQAVATLKRRVKRLEKALKEAEDRNHYLAIGLDHKETENAFLRSELRAAFKSSKVFLR